MIPAGGEIFNDLFAKFWFWSILVGVFTFGWLIHHTFWYRTSDDNLIGKRPYLRKQMESLTSQMKAAGLSVEVNIDEPDDPLTFPNIDNIKVGTFPKENDNFVLEVAWWIVPTIIIIWLMWISWHPSSDVWASEATMENYHEVGMTGQQWFWDFDCGNLPTDLCEVGLDSETGLTTLSLKKDENYKIKMTSVDVTHSPYIVQYGVKEDAIPGLYSYMAFTPTETGSFFLDCAEYCGDDHAYMTAIVVIHE